MNAISKLRMNISVTLDLLKNAYSGLAEHGIDNGEPIVKKLSFHVSQPLFQMIEFENEEIERINEGISTETYSWLSDHGKSVVEKIFQEFTDEMEVIHFDAKLKVKIAEINDLINQCVDQLEEIDRLDLSNNVQVEPKETGHYYLMISSMELIRTTFSEVNNTNIVWLLKQISGLLNEVWAEPIDPAKNPPQKILWLNEFGVIDFLREKYTSDRKIGQILGVLLGHDADNLRKIVADMRTDGAPNDPYNNKNNSIWAENQKRKIGL